MRKEDSKLGRIIDGEVSPFASSASLDNAYERVRALLGMKGEDVGDEEEVREILRKEDLYADDLADYRPDQIVALLEGYSRHRTGGNFKQGRRKVPLASCAAVSGYDVLLNLERLQSLWPHFPLVTRFANCWKLIY